MLSSFVNDFHPCVACSALSAAPTSSLGSTASGMRWRLFKFKAPLRTPTAVREYRIFPD